MVDKMFLMIPEFKITNNIKNINAAWNAFYEDPENANIVNEIDKNYGTALTQYIKDQTEDNETLDIEDIEFLDKELRQWLKANGKKMYEFSATAKKRFSEWIKKHKEEIEYETKISKIEYDDSKTPKDQSRAQRNNMLIDISYSILTNSDTASKILNPGTFDKVKEGARISVIASDPVKLNAFKIKYNLPSDEAAVNKLLSMDLNSLNKFVKEYSEERNPLSLDTFIYNHTQNMTGGALIGMYANNTTMQAKFQTTKLAIKEAYTFEIDGIRIQNLSNIVSGLGERISKNCANFSAASVDNVKDPVLADLMQNTKTANIAGFMLRAGMSIKEISLMFAQPIVRNYIKMTGGLSKFRDYLEDITKEIATAGFGFDSNIIGHNFTSKELLMNTVRNTSLTSKSLEEFEGDTIEEKEKNRYNALAEEDALEMPAALLMAHIAEMAKDLSSLTRISRADSPNGAMDTSIAGFKTQIRNVTLYRRNTKKKNFHLTGMQDVIENNFINPSMSIEEIREKLLLRKMPMLQAFYSLGIESGEALMENYFPQTSMYVNALLEEIFDNSQKGIIDSSLIETFYDDLVRFRLSKTKLFGNDSKSTFDEKRNYYLYKYPARFLKIIAENEDIAQLGIFKKMSVVEGKIVMDRSGRLSQPMRESLMRDFDTLLYMDNPKAQQLAVDLFMYSFYNDGYKFGPHSFGNFFSSVFITSFPEFIESLRTMEFDMNSNNFKNFLPQFIANHYKEFVPTYSDNNVKEGEDAVIETQFCFNYVKGGFNSFKYLNINGNLYELKSKGEKASVYTPAMSIEDPQGYKYNGNMSVSEMSTIEIDKDLVEKSKLLNSSARQTPVYDSFDNLEGISEEELNESYRDIEGMFNEEIEYNTEESNSQLKNPLCNGK